MGKLREAEVTNICLSIGNVLDNQIHKSKYAKHSPAI